LLLAVTCLDSVFIARGRGIAAALIAEDNHSECPPPLRGTDREARLDLVAAGLAKGTVELCQFANNAQIRLVTERNTRERLALPRRSINGKKDTEYIWTAIDPK
jgi:hypothetical protein